MEAMIEAIKEAIMESKWRASRTIPKGESHRIIPLHVVPNVPATSKRDASLEKLDETRRGASSSHRFRVFG